MTVRIGRTICVMLLAMAIAMLPLSMSLAVAAPALATADAAAMQAMPDCDHHLHQHGAPNGQTQKSLDHATCVVGCALCFGFVTNDVSDVAYVLMAGSALALAPASDDLPSLMGSPPFRPPRA